MAESPSDTKAHISPVPGGSYIVETVLRCLNSFIAEWDQLCPIFDSLSPSQLGGGGG
jgi:hypothetical protein